MIYPYDVYGKTKSVNEITAGDKGRLFALGYIALNVLLTLLLKGLLAVYGIPLWTLILAQVTLGIFVIIQILRFVVFREQDRALEESDVFSSYYNIAPGCATIKDPAGVIHTMSFQSGAQFGLIEFKFGMNTAEREKVAVDMFNTLIDGFNENNLSHRFIVMNEKFSESKEAELMLKKANSISDPVIRATQISIVSSLLEFANKYGSAKSLYLFIYTHSAFKLEDLEEAIRQVLIQANKILDLSPFREIKTLDNVEMLEVFRKYYGLSSVDLSLNRADEVAADFTSSVVNLYKVVSTEDKSYVAKSVFNLSSGAKRLN